MPHITPVVKGFLVACAIAGPTIACGDSSGPRSATLADLVGTWSVQAWRYSLASDQDSTVDWVTFLGLTGTLTIAADSAFSVTPGLPSGFATDNGTLGLAGDSLYWDGQNDEEWVHFTLSGARLTLRWPEIELVDIDDNGSPEDVTLHVVFVRP